MDAQQRNKFERWVKRYLPATVSLSGELQLTAITGDAGFRTYFRVNCAPSLIAVHAPPLHENNAAYVAVNLRMQKYQVHVPRIHAVDFADGYMILEDFGARLLRSELCAENVDRMYVKAVDVLRRIQSIEQDPTVFPQYDREKLLQEMQLFPAWFLRELLGVELSEVQQHMLNELFSLLLDSALEQPQCVVHRDYHSRNLMLIDNGELGVIDFQDAVFGPVTYDPVSLFKDCYVRWDAADVQRWALQFHAAQSSRHLLSGVDSGTFLRWFDWMGLQRHIKVLGIFARLWLRDGKPGYLKDLPLVIRYTLEVAQRYPETRSFYDWFVTQVEPLLSAQAWYGDWRVAGDCTGR